MKYEFVYGGRSHGKTQACREAIKNWAKSKGFRVTIGVVVGDNIYPIQPIDTKKIDWSKVSEEINFEMV